MRKNIYDKNKVQSALYYYIIIWLLKQMNNNIT